MQKLTADQVLEDDELVKYNVIKALFGPGQNRLQIESGFKTNPDGTPNFEIDLVVDDPESLSDSTRTKLRYCLDVATRLEATLGALEWQPAQPSKSTRLQDDISTETWDYARLTADHGRPCYPIESIEDMMADPQTYRKKMKPWQPTPDDFLVFSHQRDKWTEFRHEQSRLRRIMRMSQYTDFTRHLLEGDTHPLDFRFDILPSRQDPWTTWIEYLGWTVNKMKKQTTEVNRRKQRRDDLWNELRNADILRKLETPESVAISDYVHIPSWSGMSLDQELKRVRAEENEIHMSTSCEARSPGTEEMFRLRIELVPKYRCLCRSVVDAQEELKPLYREAKWALNQLRKLEYELGFDSPGGIPPNSNGDSLQARKQKEDEDAISDSQFAEVREEKGRESSTTGLEKTGAFQKNRLVDQREPSLLSIPSLHPSPQPSSSTLRATVPQNPALAPAPDPGAGNQELLPENNAIATETPQPTRERSAKASHTATAGPPRRNRGLKMQPTTTEPRRSSRIAKRNARLEESRDKGKK